MPNIEHLTPIVDPSELQAAMSALDPHNPQALLAKPDRGLLGFAEAVFGDIDQERIFAQKFFREAQGSGAHFDAYNTLISEAQPFVGVYNLVGNAVLRATVLPRHLQDYYDETHPEPTDEAKAHRRDLSKLALDEPNAHISEGAIVPGIGMVFAQFLDGRHLVHEITPTASRHSALFSPQVPASFVKFAVPKNAAVARDDFITRGYVPLSQFVEEQIAGQAYEEREGQNPQVVAEQTQRPFTTKQPKPSVVDSIKSLRSPRQKPPKRHCNLD